MVDPETVKAWTEPAGDVAQVFAFASGGLWALQRYWREREKWPRADVGHVLAHRRLGDDTLVRVTVRIENTGKVLLRLINVRTDVYRVLPLDEATRARLETGTLVDDAHEAQWTCLDSHERRWAAGEVEIEPGESDEFGFDFFVPSDVTVVSVYSYVSNVSKRKRSLGWGRTTLYDVGSPAGEDGSEAGSLSAKGAP